MDKTIGVSLVPLKFKYLFDAIDYLMIENEENGESYRLDKMIMETFHGDIQKQLLENYKINNDDLGIVYLDGDTHNTKEDNLEYAVFLDGDPVLEEKIDLEEELKSLKEQVRILKDELDLYKNKAKVAKNREQIYNEKFEYVQKLNKELNKEIRKKESEAKKYWRLLNESLMK